MPAYNFQKRFVPMILSGRKNTTIRARRKHGNAEPGKSVQLYTGMRTKQCRKIINDPLCYQVTPIIIDIDKQLNLQIVLANRQLLGPEKFDLVYSDGFDTLDQFAAFFISQYELPAQLYLIEWEPP